MNVLFDTFDWFWLIGGDQSRAWSTRLGAFVTDWPSDRAGTVDDIYHLDRLLKAHALVSPHISADDVRAEAQRRIMALVGATTLDGCIIKQLNANMRANELNDIRHDREWTSGEAAEAAALRGLANQIKAIRVASNVLEPSPPANFKADEHWP